MRRSQVRGRSRHNKQAVNSISRDCGRRTGRAPASGKRDSRIAYVDKMNGRARARDLDGSRRGGNGEGEGIFRTWWCRYVRGNVRAATRARSCRDRAADRQWSGISATVSLVAARCETRVVSNGVRCTKEWAWRTFRNSRLLLSNSVFYGCRRVLSGLDLSVGRAVLGLLSDFRLLRGFWLNNGLRLCNLSRLLYSGLRRCFRRLDLRCNRCLFDSRGMLLSYNAGFSQF